MSLEDLENLGVLKPRGQWGKGIPGPAVNKVWFVITGVLATASAVTMYWGGGGAMTWIAAGCFLVSLAVLTNVCLRAIKRQSHSE